MTLLKDNAVVHPRGVRDITVLCKRASEAECEERTLSALATIADSAEAAAKARAAMRTSCVWLAPGSSAGYST